MNCMGRGQIRGRRAYIEILNRNVLHIAMGTAPRLDADGLLTVCATRSIGSILDNAAPSAIHDDITAALHADRAGT